ncbi:MAG: YbdK family carboxylate-amine ligase [Actinobacteria bacterium]|nr:YbdK family carboxylate-amine ligase [Actinomycetota bacterium]
MTLDLDGARERFEESTDFTIGLEEEFAILDPGTLALVDRYEEMKARCDEDEVLGHAAAGELIASEIEIRSGRAETFAEAVAAQQDRRDRLFTLAESMGVALGAMGTHPWANYLDQTIIDTDHYNRLREELGYVAQRNNTWSLHVHVGVRGADRAIAVCDRLRELLPPLLALSANSPFLDRRDTGLASVRSEIFTRTFPRCGVPSPFVDWDTYAGFIDMLQRTNSVIESTQLWWSVRPHHSFGTVEVRICDAQTRGEEASAIAGMIVACVAQTAMDLDERGEAHLAAPLADREIEENLWRAIRYGAAGKMIDFRAGEEVETRAVFERLLAWTEPARSSLDIEVALPEATGAERSRAALQEGVPLEDVYRAAVAETARTYAPGRVAR